MKSIERKTISHHLKNVNISPNLTFKDDSSYLSYGSDNTSKMAGSSLPDLPEWSLEKKIDYFMISKSVEKKKKKSLQKLKTYKPKVVQLSDPSVITDPSYFRCHYPMESIFFFLASFIFSSILHMDIGPMTFLSCILLQDFLTQPS